MIKRTVSIITILAAAFALTISASGQSKKDNTNARFYKLLQAAKTGTAKLDPEIAQQVRDDFRGEPESTSLFGHSIGGSWNIKVAESDGGFPPFEALHTFGLDGTFVETSSNLATGTEGPAHGVWERVRPNRYLLTFELFIFDPQTGASVGRVRVRCSIQMRSANELTAMTAVDVIEPDGTVISDVDGGPFEGSRIRVQGL